MVEPHRDEGFLPQNSVALQAAACICRLTQIREVLFSVIATGTVQSTDIEAPYVGNMSSRIVARPQPADESPFYVEKKVTIGFQSTCRYRGTVVCSGIKHVFIINTNCKLPAMSFLLKRTTLLTQRGQPA